MSHFPRGGVSRVESNWLSFTVRRPVDVQTADSWSKYQACCLHVLQNRKVWSSWRLLKVHEPTSSLSLRAHSRPTDGCGRETEHLESRSAAQQAGRPRHPHAGHTQVTAVSLDTRGQMVSPRGTGPLRLVKQLHLVLEQWTLADSGCCGPSAAPSGQGDPHFCFTLWQGRTLLKNTSSVQQGGRGRETT